MKSWMSALRCEDVIPHRIQPGNHHQETPKSVLEIHKSVAYRPPGRRSVACYVPLRHAGVVKLVDAPDSKSGSERSVGSIPTTRTINFLQCLCRRRPARAAESPGWAADSSAERGAERAGGFIADGFRYLIQRLSAPAQGVLGETHSPPGQVFHRRTSDGRNKAGSKRRPRHARAFG